MDLTVLVIWLISVVVGFAILHAVVRSAVGQALHRHTLWLDARSAPTPGTLPADTDFESSSWTLRLRGKDHTVVQLNGDTWAVTIGDETFCTVRRDPRGFYADGSAARHGTLDDAIRKAPLFG